MSKHEDETAEQGPGMMDHAISALNACFGDSLAETQGVSQREMAFYRNNRPIEAEEFGPVVGAKACVLVHGLGCNESLWNFPAAVEGSDYGRLLEEHDSYTPLYVRYNTGRHISTNGRQLADLLQRFSEHQGSTLKELLLIGHSMGGLVIRSACFVGSESDQDWVSQVRHAVYLGSPHMGAPLEKATNIASHVLGLFDTTATRVVREVLNARSAGIKDLRFGNLVEQDFCDADPDELLKNCRLPIPWLESAHHHLVVGEAIAGVKALGDAVVLPRSAGALGHGGVPGAPEGSDIQLMPGLDHMALARHPAVFKHIKDWVEEDG